MTPVPRGQHTILDKSCGDSFTSDNPASRVPIGRSGGRLARAGGRRITESRRSKGGWWIVWIGAEPAGATARPTGEFDNPLPCNSACDLILLTSR